MKLQPLSTRLPGMGISGHLKLYAATAVGLATVDGALKAWSHHSTDEPIHTFGSIGPFSAVRGDDTHGGPAGLATGIKLNAAPQLAGMAMGIAASVALTHYSGNRMGAVAAGMITGGMLSNGGESVLTGAVSNHTGLDVGSGGPIMFNLADLALVTAPPLIAVAMLRR